MKRNSSSAVLLQQLLVLCFKGYAVLVEIRVEVVSAENAKNLQKLIVVVDPFEEMFLEKASGRARCWRARTHSFEYLRRW